MLYSFYTIIRGAALVPSDRCACPARSWRTYGWGAMGILRRGGASSLRASHTIIVIFICILAFSLPACNRDVYDNLFDPVNQYTVTFDSQGGTAVSAQTVDYGTTISQPADPVLTGYTFAGWFTEPSCANPWLFGSGKVEGDTTLYARWTINQYTVAFDPQGGSAIAPQTVNHNGYAADPGAPARTGYTFGGWFQEAGCVTQWVFAIDTVTENRTLYAQWTINTYTLAYTAGANGSLTGSTTQFVTHGANGTAVTAVPNVGYHFTSWSDGSTDNPRTDTGVTGNITVTANFAINQYTLSYSAGANGSLSGATAQVVNHGSDGTAVTAVPNVGYHFTSWSDGVLTATRTDTNVTSTITVSANFAINQYTLTYTAGANGTIAGTTPQTVNHGADGTAVTATPNVGHHFTSWSDGVLTATRTDTNVTGAITVTASFAINTYTLTYNAGAGGSITGSSPQTVNHGSNGTAVTATPNVGYHFTSWSDGGLIATRTDTNITGDMTVIANFAIDTFTVSFDSQGGSAVGSQVVNYGGLVSEPGAPTKPNFVFGGWFKEPTCTTSWLFASDTIMGVTTIYAKWTNWIYGGSGHDDTTSIQLTTDGGYIIAGDTSSNDGDVTGNHGNYDYWVVKLDSAGSIQWQKCLGGSSNEVSQSIKPTTDGGYIIAGNTSSNDGDVTGHHGLQDFWVVKLDSAGSIQWQKCLGGSSHDAAYSVQQTADGGYIVAGSTSSNDGDVTGYHGLQDSWIVKLNASGTIQWQKCLGGSSDDYIYDVQQTADGGYIVAGTTYSNDGDVTGNHGGYDYWIVKLNASGVIQWQKCLGGSGSEWAYSVQQTADGGYIVAGYTYSNDGDVTGNHGNNDYWVVKLDSAGSIQWQKFIGGSSNEFAQSIKPTTDGGYIIAGYTSSNDGDVTGNHGGYDYWIVKLNASGVIQWQKCLGGSVTDAAFSVQQIADGGYIVAGSTLSNNGDVTGNHGGYDIWIVKLDASGNF